MTTAMIAANAAIYALIVAMNEICPTPQEPNVWMGVGYLVAAGVHALIAVFRAVDETQ